MIFWPDNGIRCANCHRWSAGAWIPVTPVDVKVEDKPLVVCSELCLRLFLKQQTGKPVVKADDLTGKPE